MWGFKHDFVLNCYVYVFWLGGSPFKKFDYLIGASGVKELSFIISVVLCNTCIGSLIDCYDELGIRYQLPPYVLSAPTNLIEDRGSSETAAEETPVRLSRSRGVELPIRLQLSTGKDLKLTVRSTDTILLLKRQIQSLEGISASRVRLFFAGRQLTDRMRIKDAKIHKHYTIQVIVTEPAAAEIQIPPIPPPPLQLTAVPTSLGDDGDSWLGYVCRRLFCRFESQLTSS